ncbi:vimentin-type intermediate filament-associated coiled-coil protein-like [Littorina saxatilis]|uniref:Uncharacterized protein n=1 Tax=Littorina saxatilis TaxID=31220 RepID=A0AAN9B6N6_9CAEN
MIPRTSIDEANKHLSLLHTRVSGLEKTVAEQHDALVAKDEHLQSKLAEISSAKDAEIEGLRRKLHETERTVYLLQQQVQHKDHEIETLQHKFGSLETLLSHRTSVQHLLHAMKEAEKNIREVDHSRGSPPPDPHAHSKDPPMNGVNGVLSSPESHTDHKADHPTKRGSAYKKGQGKSKKGTGKEFYL